MNASASAAVWLTWLCSGCGNPHPVEGGLSIIAGTKSRGGGPASGRGTALTRRELLGALAVLAGVIAATGARAQISDWSEADRSRFFTFRQAFGEYGDLSDAEFARRMETLFSSLASNPDAEVIVAEVSRRLPEYQDVPRRRMQREMVSLFRKARQHFQR
ncbi:MAG: hypothetical protein MUD06_15105 [Rhodospirillales bacterium]|nr:hypothetical protein [Rhodospirillales bacterium]